MYKKLLATAFTVLLLVATLAYAATNMQVTASAVPVSGGSITPNGIKFSSTFINYSVSSKAGWSLTNVKIDNVVATSTTSPNHFQVPFDMSKVHTIKANFAQALYTITTTAGTGGTLTVTGGGNVNITPGSDRSVVVAPSTGYQIATLTVDGAPVTPANPTIAYTQAYTNIQASKSVSATFNLNPAANTVVNAGTYWLVGTASTTLTGTATSLVTPIIYQWNLVSGPAGSTFGTPTAAATTFNGLVTGTYNVTLTANGAVSAPVVIRVDTSFANPGMTNPLSTQCITCHAGSAQVVAYSTSVHAVNNAPCAGCHTHGTQKQCATCHSAVGANNALAFVSTCQMCHGSATVPIIDVHGFQAGAGQAGCVPCHGGGDAHKTKAANGCIGCHDIPISNHPGTVVADNNNGVRAITTEFAKWSHHVTGVTLNNAHCAACHLEGKVTTDGQVAIDDTYHMADAMTHLRNADTDADMQWDPAAPNHSTMDNFCMSCHDANGATSAGNNAVQSYINNNGLVAVGKTASATNPFGDTISNQYDKMQRPAVVNVTSQFNTTNNSHHAVKGPRYTGRTRLAGARQITSAGTFANNSSATLPGKRNTIFDAGKFNQLYVPLVNDGGEAAPRTGAATLGDDSTLHCGDCHTVGQWKVGSSANAAGQSTPAAIGAHGSANEYMLRNSIGTDARHQGIQMDTAMHVDSITPYLVCYNCHAIANYGLAAHVGEQVVGENNCNTATNTNTVNATGTDRLNSQNTMTYNSGANVAGAFDGATASNIYGIQCNNCHNSGISAGNIFGGIHGSADPTYQDGVNNTTKHERFLPGLGNVKYVPGTRGGITGGTVAFASYSSKVQASGISKGLSLKGSYSYTTGGVTNDTNWEEKARIPVGDGVTAWSHNPGAAGCYTISAGDDENYNAESNGVPAGPAASKGLTDPNGTLLYGNWGGCADHSQQSGSSVRQPRSSNTSIRPVTY